MPTMSLQDVCQSNLYSCCLTLCERCVQRQKCDSNKVQAFSPTTLCSISRGQSDKFTKPQVFFPGQKATEPWQNKFSGQLLRTISKLIKLIKEQTRSKSIWKRYCLLEVAPIKKSKHMLCLLHKGEEENKRFRHSLFIFFKY